MSRNLRIALFLVVSILFTTFSFYAWQIFKTPNFLVEEEDKEKEFALLIPKGATFASVMDTLEGKNIVNDRLSFRFCLRP